METIKLKHKICLIIVIAILTSYKCLSQTNYLPGYVINLKNDSIKGFIDYKNWDKNPTEISFKVSLNENRIKYEPKDILGFAVLNEIYKSAIIEKEVSTNYINNFQYNAELKFDIATTFLQTIISGNKSLFCLKDKNSIEQFYIMQDTSYKLLIHKRYLKIQDEKEMIVENNNFIGQLLIYLQDCLSIQNQIKNTKYDKSDLEKLFLIYYNCENSAAKFQKKTEKIIPQLGIFFGVSNTSIKFAGDYYLVGVKLKSSNNFSGGLFCDFILPRNRGKWSINNELLYSSYKMSGHYDDYYSPASLEIGYTYLKLNNMLRYKYPIGSFFPFINIGISNGVFVREINNKINESVFHPNTNERALADTRNFEQGYILGVGSKFKNYSFEIRYENSNGISAYRNLKTPTKRLYFFLGYKF
jgi:hypothetical protein